MIIAVIYTTFTVGKRKPEKNSGLYGIRIELANQRARKALFSFVVYMYTPRPRWKGFNESATSKKPIDIMNLKLFYMNFFSDILMQIKFNYTRKLLHLALF